MILALACGERRSGFILVAAVALRSSGTRRLPFSDRLYVQADSERIWSAPVSPVLDAGASCAEEFTAGLCDGAAEGAAANGRVSGSAGSCFIPCTNA